MYHEYEKISDEKAKQLVLDRIKQSQSSIARQRFLSKCRKNHKLYKCWTEDRYRLLVANDQAWRSNIFIPQAHTDIETFIPDSIFQIFASSPIVRVEPVLTNNMRGAKIIEAVNDMWLNEMDIFMKLIVGMKACAKQGVEIGYPYWREEIRILEKLTDKELKLFGISLLKLPGKTLKEYPFYSKYGPDLEWSEYPDNFPDPAYANVEDMNWFIRQHFKSMDYLKYMASEKAGKVFKNVDKIKNSAGSEIFPDEVNRRINEYVSPMKDIDSDMVALHTCYEDDRLIILANGDTVIYNDRNPEWNKRKFIVDMHCIPQEHSFWSEGLIDMSAQINNATNDFFNILFDSMKSQANNMLVVIEDSLKNGRQDLAPRPNGVIYLKKNAPMHAVQPLRTNLANAGTNWVLEYLSGWGQNASGQFDIKRGKTDRRETLGTNQMLNDAASSRNKLAILVMSITGLVKLSEMNTALGHTHMEKGRLARLAYMDENTNEEVKEYIDDVNRNMLPMEKMNYKLTLAIEGKKEINARRMQEMVNRYYGRPEIDNTELIKTDFEHQKALGLKIPDTILKSSAVSDKIKQDMISKGLDPMGGKLKLMNPEMYNRMVKGEPPNE